MSNEHLSEIRRANLLFLIEQYGSLKRLNIALGRKSNDATLSQIKNKAPSSRTGTVRNMGVAIARDIEKKLNYDFGWMDVAHPEIQPVPLNKENEFTKNKQKENPDSQPLTIAPLFEIRRRTTDGKFVPLRIGDIKVPDIFIERSAYSFNPKNLQSFYIDDLTATDFVPFGSIIVLDKSVHSYTKDGLYLVELNGSVFFRKIISSVKGGYLVFSSSENFEHVQDLNDIKILGAGLFYWLQQKL